MNSVEAQHKDYEDTPSAPQGKLSAANHDGWYWKKSGDKAVQGSSNTRSLYKCCHAACGAKKFVERSPSGDILSTEYKGEHCHAVPVAAKATRFRPGAQAEAQSDSVALPPLVTELVGLSKLPGNTNVAALSPTPEALHTDGTEDAVAEDDDDDDDINADTGPVAALRAAPQDAKAALHAAKIIMKVCEQQKQKHVNVQQQQQQQQQQQDQDAPLSKRLCMSHV